MKKTKPAITRSHLAARTKSSLSLSRRPLVAAIALSLSLPMGNAQAANIWVDSPSDTDTGVCRLRDAIIAANTDAVVEGCTAGSGADFIRLLNIAGSTITLNSTRLPTIMSDVTIQGESVTIDAAGNSGVLDVSGGSVSINRLSLVNGYADEVDDHSGGGIRVRNGAHLTLHESTVSNSTATSNGGGISVENGGEYVVISGSTLSNNAALGTVAGTYGSGGGVFLAPPVAGDITLSLINSTLSGNTASVTTGYGGGLYEFSELAPGNATITIVNSTLFGNTAGKQGGGLYRNNSGLVLLNSIIANSTAISDPDTASCNGPIAALPFNYLGPPPPSISLIEIKGNCILGGGVLNVNPELGPLVDNGGPTMTHAPMAGSPVIDALNQQCFSWDVLDDDENIFYFDLVSDQRGFERTDGMCDPGAFEVGGAALQAGPNFVVNSIEDKFTQFNLDERALTVDGHCNIAPGDCTLRDAVREANVSADASVITFAESLDRPISILTAGVEPLLVTSDLAIQGSGVNIGFLGEVRLPWTTRHITLDSAHLVLNGLTLANGIAQSGGAILARNQATLVLANSTLSANSASLYGGGIAAEPGASVTLTDSIVSRNRANLQGGGIHLSGTTESNVTLSISNSDIVGNSNTAISVEESCDADLVPGISRCAGGGIFIDHGTADLVDSDVSRNTARGRPNNSEGFGGGIYSANSVVTLTRSTLADNEALGEGGGLWLVDSDLTLTNSTLSGNKMLILGGAIASTGNGTTRLVSSTVFGNGEFVVSQGTGGINAGHLELTNSIIANSSVRDCLVASVTANGVNLIGDGLGCGLLAPGPNVLSGDAMLGPLANNGGLTQTHEPRVGSPVINSGDNAAVPEGLLTDQRGNGYPRFFEINVDLGSVEWAPYIFRDGFEDPGP